MEMSSKKEASEQIQDFIKIIPLCWVEEALGDSPEEPGEVAGKTEV